MDNLKKDKRIVLTLDAGGTNFVFSAIQRGEIIAEPVKIKANGDNLELCLKGIIKGFSQLKNKLEAEPVAISFAFPGPADYPNGIIGDLGNMKGFRGGVALGAILEEEFKIPVFINNDGNLFAYGEALAGELPDINSDLKEAGNSKRYKNLVGLTLGTGFGAGFVFNNQLLIGDNSLGGEVWLTSTRNNKELNAEELVSARAIVNKYAKLSGTAVSDLMPADVFKIAKGDVPGDKNAAKQAFEYFGRALGNSVANLITLFDSIVVIGGGITGAKEFYMQGLMSELENDFTSPQGNKLNRLVQKAYNYSNEIDKQEFLKSEKIIVKHSGIKKEIDYNYKPKVPIVHSKMGASRAILLGAYFYAIEKLNKK